MNKEASVNYVEKSETKPIDVPEIRCGRGELETLLVASLQDPQAPNPRSNALQREPEGIGKRKAVSAGNKGRQRTEGIEPNPCPRAAQKMGSQCLMHDQMGTLRNWRCPSS
jgi:hypothetical protein